jgi:endoglycosylceramidase
MLRAALGVLLVSLLAACGRSEPGPTASAVGGALGCSVEARPGPPQLRRDGRWLVDPQGRVVLLHGVNLVWKNAPFVPPASAEGFIEADADWLRDHGFNSARVGTLWVGVTPEAPGQVDAAYLEAWDRVIQLLAARGIWMLFDFHQDMLGPIYQGEGVPEWAVEALEGPTTTLLGPPMFGFPFNYFTPQVSEAFDNLWAERGMVWDGFRDAWIAVASKWRNQPYSMGYDLLNEPWSGLEWPTCIFPPQLGCPATDENEIQPFFEHALRGIRSVDQDNLVWLEPQLLAGGTGSPTGFQPIDGETQLGYSIHNYCPLTALAQAAQLGLPVPLPVGPQDTCEDFEANNFAQSRAAAERIGAVELMTEFGATDDLELLARVTRLADENLVGWQYWHYKEWSDPTTQSQDSGGQGLFTDDADLGSVKLEKLKQLERTYPRATAGEPLALSFDPVTAQFSYRYTPRCAAGPTEIYVPALHHPNGYRVEVSGARVVSAPGAALLLLENLAEATEVSVTISPE